MSQDTRAEMMDDPGPFDIFIEVHCRRCASHMGHILLVDGKLLHCINGTSLNFVEATT
jgi:peptide-methionine (R)-S-oxide reductase